MESRNLTIMMTDIQGFTQRTSKMSREEIENLLHRHEQILGPVFGEYGGTVVKTIGDAFLVTFTSATQGLEAGMRIQRDLAAHNAGADEDEKLRVRVVLNAGEVNVRDGDVFGEPVNVTARVEGVGEAGHVTFTEAVRLLLGGDGLPLESLGEFELKGIPKPVRLHRVIPDWHVEAPLPGAPEAEAPAPSEDPVPPAGSAAHGGLPAVLVAVLALLGLGALAWSMLGAEDPLDEARRLVESGRSREALVRLDEILRSAPGRVEAARMLRRCRLALLGEALAAGRHGEALDHAEALLARDRNDDQALRLALRAVEGGVETAIAGGRPKEGEGLVERLAGLFPDHEALKALRTRLGTARLGEVYEAAMACRSKGMAQVLRVFKDGGFEGTLAALRRDGVKGPRIDWLEARYIMLRVAALRPSEFERQSSYSRPDLPRCLDLYGRALEGDPSFRGRRECLPELEALCKLVAVEPRLDDRGRQLRKLVVDHHGEWIVEALTRMAVAAPDGEDGKGKEEFAYRQRAHARAMLARLGAESRVDRGRLLRLDVQWMEAKEDDDHELKTRMARITSEVAALGARGLVTDAADALRRIAARGDEHWILRANEGLSALGEKTEADDWAAWKAGLDGASSALSHAIYRYPKQEERQQWPKNRILALLEEVSGLRAPSLRVEAARHLELFASPLGENFPEGAKRARAVAAGLK